jgi:hypothetical protein
VDRGWTIFVRCAGVSAALALVGVCVSDFYTDFWVEHAMLTAVLSALLVATVLVAIVDTYLERYFNLAARDLTPLEDWMGAPEWFRPTREREIAPAG